MRTLRCNVRQNLAIVVVPLLLGLLFSCEPSGKGDAVPQLVYRGASKTILQQGDLNQDSLWLLFDFEDGDGDLGFGSGDPSAEVYLWDERTGNLHNAFKLPDLPPSGGSSQKGSLRLLVFTTCCLFPDNIPPCSAPPQYPTDSLRFSAYLTDRAGHQSPRVFSDRIELRCQ
ncbi:MAG: hypothetical protein IT266_01450 [Saprospiraceae bacterium]|nr:hypothetical protein [Saprospiraceae bacterium]